MDYEERKNSYFKNNGRGRLVWTVIGVHALIVGVPLVYVLIWNSFVPKQYVIEVGLAEAPKGDSLDVPQTQSVSPEPTRESVPDLPKPRTVSEPVPNVEQMPEEPTVEPEPVKTVTDPVTAPKEDTKKTEPKKTEPKKSTILSPSEINVDKTVVKKSPTPSRSTTVASTNNNQNDISGQLKSLSDQMKIYGTQNPGREGFLSTSEMNDYQMRLKNYVEPKWVQPDASSLNNRKPSVEISLTIEKSGRVKAKKIVRKSGIAAMDRSIDELLAKLNTVPVPPEGNLTISITLTIR